MNPQLVSSPLFLQDLIKKHSKIIFPLLHDVKAFLAKHPDPNIQKVVDQIILDEIYVLRFVLTEMERKSIDVRKSSLRAIKKNLEFRAEHFFVLSTLQEDTFVYDKRVATKRIPDIGMNMVIYTRCSAINFAALSKESIQETTEIGLLNSEYLRRELDRRSRSTGRLIKQITLVDLKNLSLTNVSLKVLKALNDTYKNNEILSPHSLVATVIIHPPKFFNLVANLISPFQTFLEKMVVCGGKDGKDPDSCPFLSKITWEFQTIPTEYSELSRLKLN